MRAIILLVLACFVILASDCGKENNFLAIETLYL